MRRLFVLTVAAAAMILGAASLWADNQEEANRIAQKLGETYPQYNIEVAFQEGKVRLRGEIGSQEDRAAITQFVGAIPNVHAVSESFVVTQNPGNAMQADRSYTEQTSPISTTLQSSSFLPVSALRADEPTFVAQTPADENYLSDAIPLAAPPVVTEGDAMPMVNQQMPMGTIIADDGVSGYTQTVGGVSDYLPPQGRTMTPGQSAQPNMPNYAWPTTADYPNYSQVSYPKQYAGGAFPYIGPFYPYPQVPLGWRKVTMEWHDGYWWLDFNDGSASGPFSPLFRHPTKYR